MKLLWIIVLLGVLSLFVHGETQHRRMKRDDGKIFNTMRVNNYERFRDYIHYLTKICMLL